MTDPHTLPYPAIAALVYQACNHFDPYLPPLSDDMGNAWGRLFERHRLSLDELLAGVDKVYDEHGSGYRPLPKDLIDAARAIRKQRRDQTGPTDAYYALCDSKAAPDAPALSPPRQAKIEQFRGSFGKPPGTAAAEAQARILATVERQRRAAPPAPMPADTGAGS